AFLQQPTNTTAGAAITPAVTVQLLDQFNNLTGSTATVTLVANGPGPFTGGSTTSVAAVNGVATFNNLHLNTAGTYTLGANSPGLTGTTSNSFQVTAAAADHLTFTQQPTDTTAGQPINASTNPVGVRVSFFDVFNNLLTNDNTDTVTLAINSGPSGTLG